MRCKLPLLTAFAGLCLVACASRTATPVAISQPGDDQLTCPQIAEQRRTNQAAADELLRRDRQVEGENAAKVALSVVPLVGLVTAANIDLSNVEQVKARSLVDRNDRLSALSRSKGCSEP
jgi:hypothetical protein